MEYVDENDASCSPVNEKISSSHAWMQHRAMPSIILGLNWYRQSRDTKIQI